MPVALAVPVIVLVALLLFEIVHDVQYNVLVWYYNRRRVAQGLTSSHASRTAACGRPFHL